MYRTFLVFLLSLPTAVYAGTYASSLVDYSTVTFGDPYDVLGAPDAYSYTGGPYDGYAEFDGDPGYVIVDFSNPIIDLPGNDLLVHVLDFNDEEEKFNLYASTDAINYFFVGSANPTDFSFGIDERGQIPFDLSLSGLSQAWYLKLENGTSSYETTHEGPEIDAFEVIPEPTTLGLILLGGLAIARRRKA